MRLPLGESCISSPASNTTTTLSMNGFVDPIVAAIDSNNAASWVAVGLTIVLIVIELTKLGIELWSRRGCRHIQEDLRHNSVVESELSPTPASSCSSNMPQASVRIVAENKEGKIPKKRESVAADIDNPTPA